MSIFTSRILKPAAVVGIATLSLTACKSDDEKAREVLSEALQSYGSVQDTEISASDRLAALSDVEMKLASIAGEFATTDVGLKLAGQEAFGVLDPKELPTLKTQLSELVAAETCAEFPTIQCIFAIMKAGGLDLPSPGNDPLETIWGVILSTEYTPREFASTQVADDVAPFVAFASIFTGNEQKGQQFFEALQPHEDPKIAMALSLISRLDSSLPEPSNVNVIDTVENYILSLDDKNNPVFAIATGLFDASVEPQDLNKLWDTVSEQSYEPEFPTWLYDRYIATHINNPT